MARIRIQEPHSLSADEARTRLDGYFGELANASFQGVTISDFQKSWNGSRMETTFFAKKSIFSQKIKGSLDVEPASVMLEVEVPEILFSFVPKNKVEGIVREKLRAKLA